MSAPPETHVARVDKRYIKDTMVVAVVGDADLQIAPDLRDHLDAAPRSAQTDIVLDLSKATLIDSVTLGVVLRAAKRLRAQSRQLHVVVPHTALRRMFEITLLDRVVALHVTRADALAAAVASRGRDASGGATAEC